MNCLTEALGVAGQATARCWQPTRIVSSCSLMLVNAFVELTKRYYEQNDEVHSGSVGR
ncbi:hypothetical protein ACNKHU_23735 [Shigella flexneri]